MYVEETEISFKRESFSGWIFKFFLALAVLCVVASSLPFLRYLHSEWVIGVTKSQNPRQTATKSWTMNLFAHNTYIRLLHSEVATGRNIKCHNMTSKRTSINVGLCVVFELYMMRSWSSVGFLITESDRGKSTWVIEFDSGHRAECHPCKAWACEM